MRDQAYRLRNYINNHGNTEPSGISYESGCRVMTVTSGKGGVGKTNFTVNFALSLADKGLRVLIIDADFGLANVDVILGITPKYDLSYVVNKGMDIQKIITEGPKGIKFISGGSGVYDLINLPREQLVRLVNSLMKLEDLADVIIFDTGAGISENIIHLIASSSDVIIVTTPEPTAIMDAYAVVKTIADIDSGFNLKLVVNKAENEYEGAVTMENFTRVVKNYLNLDVDSLGYILSDDSVPKSVKEQTPLLLNCPKCTASRNIQEIAHRYMGFIDEIHEKNGIRGFITKLLKSFAKS